MDYCGYWQQSQWDARGICGLTNLGNDDDTYLNRCTGNRYYCRAYLKQHGGDEVARCKLCGDRVTVAAIYYNPDLPIFQAFCPTCARKNQLEIGG